MGKVEQEFHPELSTLLILFHKKFLSLCNVSNTLAGPRATGKKAKIDNYNIAGKSGPFKLLALKKIMFVLLSV